MRRVVAFGSRATWTAKEYSDLDLAVLGDEPLPLDAAAALAEGFGESDLPFKVDVVVWADINDHLRGIIRRDAVDVQTPETDPASTPGPPSSADRLHLSARHRRVLEALLREHLPDVEVWAYGSRVNGRSHTGSDLDLVLRGPGLEKIPSEQLADFADAVRESTIPFLVQAKDWARLPDSFRREIERDQVELGRSSAPTHPRTPRQRHGHRVCAFRSLFAEPTRNGLTRPKAVRGSGVKMVNMGELFAHPRLNRVAMDRVPLDLTKESKYLLQDRDLLFARQSLVLKGAGKCSIFFADHELTTFESHVIRVRLNPSLADPLYYYYYWQSRQGQSGIRSIVEQGARASGIRATDLANLPVTWPPVDEQHAIAHILGTLDDKIELNRRMNETLEAMARALFKSWFVDFEPTRAKMAGGHLPFPRQVTDLFPDRLVESSIGMVPGGWHISEIGKEVAAVGGATPSTKEAAFWTPEEHAWATPKDLSALTAPVLLDTAKKVTSTGLATISSGLLPKGTVLMSSLAPIGHLAIAETPVAVNQGFIAMVCRQRLPNLYVLFWCRENLPYIRNIAGGSTFAEISKKAFRPIPVLVPPPSALDSFSRLVDPLYDRIVGNVRQTTRLTGVRNLLLPKLVSGEIRVSQAERVLEKAL